MATSLITQNIWKEITKEVKKSKTRSFVAVAYFGKGGAKMLPLKSGSKLVVDASDHIVKAGQTDPKELLKLYKKGVQIYSLPNLHAKLFMIGNKLFIGSTNVSSNSSDALQEAVVLISENKVIVQSKRFIEGLCDYELGEEQLKSLIKIYRPPKFHGQKKKRTRSSIPKEYNRIRVVNMGYIDYPDGYEEPLEEGRQEASKKQISKERHQTDEFYWSTKPSYKRGDLLLRIIKDGKKKMVYPPSIVVLLKRWGRSNYFVFVEFPNKRAKNIIQVRKKLTPKERKALERGGIKSPELSAKLISMWN